MVIRLPVMVISQGIHMQNHGFTPETNMVLHVNYIAMKKIT